MALTSDKELLQLKNRLRELAEKSYSRSIFTFTGFLGLSEQDLFWKEEPGLRFAGYQLWGGSEGCDRQVLRFGSAQELGYEEPFGITCIHIFPPAEKFADDFSHRDFLGALMNLGIDRSTLGDIRVGDREAFLFCLDNVAEFICENLTQVKHTRVRCEIVTQMRELPSEEPKLLDLQVMSERIDAVIAKVYNKSRNEVLNLFHSGKVYVNGRLCESNSRMLKPEEVVNVRGFGKFVYQGVQYETRKGRLSVRAAVYR